MTSFVRIAANLNYPPSTLGKVLMSLYSKRFFKKFPLVTKQNMVEALSQAVNGYNFVLPMSDKSLERLRDINEKLISAGKPMVFEIRGINEPHWSSDDVSLTFYMPSQGDEILASICHNDGYDIATVKTELTGDVTVADLVSLFPLSSKVIFHDRLLGILKEHGKSLIYKLGLEEEGVTYLLAEDGLRPLHGDYVDDTCGDLDCPECYCQDCNEPHHPGDCE